MASTNSVRWQCIGIEGCQFTGFQAAATRCCLVLLLRIGFVSNLHANRNAEAGTSIVFELIDVRNRCAGTVFLATLDA